MASLQKPLAVQVVGRVAVGLGEPGVEPAAHDRPGHRQRLAEAPQVWSALAAGGFRDGMIALLDFVLYGRDGRSAQAIADQIRTTYAVSVSELPGEGWMVSGSTAPYGSALTQARHAEWVQYLCELATAHGFVFSAWAVEAPALSLKVTSASFDAGLPG